MGIRDFFGGTPALLIATGLGGMAAGAFLSGVWNDATAGREYKRVAQQSSDAIVTILQNAGRREMNYLFRAEADRAQCTATVETFNHWDELSAEAKAAAQRSAKKLAQDLGALSARYDELVKSYETADRRVGGWYGADLPRDVCGVRYGEACGSDPLAAAGYPDPPDRPPALAKPAH